MRGTARVMLSFSVVFSIVTGAFLLSAVSAAAGAEAVKIQELIERAEDYDGRHVTIEGEAIGDIMARGEMAWITVNDDAYSEAGLGEGGDFAGISNSGIGVWLPAEEARKVRLLGGYKNKGDRVVVTGVFHRADRENGGDMCIRGVYLEVVERGYPIAHPVPYLEMAVALLLFCVVLALGRIWWKGNRAA
jgi:hypothetical protein